MYPNYVNVDWSNDAGYDENDPHTYASSMGCRTRVGYDVNGLGFQRTGRGNICPVTIIMPTLAMYAKERYEDLAKNMNNPSKDWQESTIVELFIQILTENIDKAKDILLERFEYICSQKPDAGKFIYENNVMSGYKPEEGIRSALKHGSLAIGNIGLAETLQILIGKDHTSGKGMLVAKRIYQLLKDKCKEFTDKYKLNFSNYYTPAENLCYTSLLKFRERFGIIPNVSDRLYFTNSMHVPVWQQVDPFRKIDIESQLTGYSSGGCITYTELSSGVQHNIAALEKIVNYAMDKDIPYCAINIPIDDCKDCGASGEFGETCPECGGNHIDRLRRITGYLSTSYTHFNLGKQAETLDRVKHQTKFDDTEISNTTGHSVIEPNSSQTTE